MVWPAKSRKCTNSAACSSTAVHQNASIVLNGSMVSLKGVPAFGVYAATKAAVRSFARTWSVDLRERRIRVNVVAPGTVITPAYRSELGMTDDQVKQFEAQAAAATPLGRAVTPDEIAKAVLFLASDDSSYVTGIELFVDGGAAQIQGRTARRSSTFRRLAVHHPLLSFIPLEHQALLPARRVPDSRPIRPQRVRSAPRNVRAADSGSPGGSESLRERENH